MRTPLFAAHQKLGARIIDFNGWEMPVQYAAIEAEHRAVREKCGIFDTCHMGEFLLRAAAVRTALNLMLTGDFHAVPNGRMRYGFITNENGGVIDDVVTLLLDDATALICVNAGDIGGDEAALRARLPAGATLENISAATAKLDVQGAAARELVRDWLGFDFFTLPFYAAREIDYAGEKLRVGRSGYTGSPGVEIFAPAALAEKLWDAGLARGAAPCGLGARDTLRLEAGLPLYGHELNQTVNPLMAGFGKFVALTKAEDFCGKAALQKIAAAPLTKTLRGLRLTDKRLPRAGFKVLDAADATVGEITSGAPAWSVGGSAAFAYIDTAATPPLFVDIRGQKIPATVAETPFFKSEELRVKS
ncbi:aminomethyltransferase [Planctomycetales bacterium]|nr:aminomethyltransferase [Planctomycetales bacterium]